jgi:hypothetical protein
LGDTEKSKIAKELTREPFFPIFHPSYLGNFILHRDEQINVPISKYDNDYEVDEFPLDYVSIQNWRLLTRFTTM